jgi:hypothetical protein
MCAPPRSEDVSILKNLLMFLLSLFVISIAKYQTTCWRGCSRRTKFCRGLRGAFSLGNRCNSCIRLCALALECGSCFKCKAIITGSSHRRPTKFLLTTTTNDQLTNVFDFILFFAKLIAQCYRSVKKIIGNVN